MVGNSVKIPYPVKFAFPGVPATGKVRVIGIVPGQLYTEHRVYSVTELARRDVARLAVIERHGKNGNVAYAFVEGSGLRRGALATTVAHDSHNLLVLGRDDDMLFAAETLAGMGGGAVAVEKREILAAMPLAIGGLMSELPAEEVAAQDRALKDAVRRKLGVTLDEPLTTLSFLSLPVIPALRLTDRGLFDASVRDFVPLFFDQSFSASSRGSTKNP